MIVNTPLRWRACVTWCAMATDLNVSKRQLRAACAAWSSGGTLALGLWLSKHKPRFSTHDYGELVAMVRAELHDDTDYGAQ